MYMNIHIYMYIYIYYIYMNITLFRICTGKSKLPASNRVAFSDALFPYDYIG